MIGSTLALLGRSLREDARLLRSHAARLLFLGLIYFSLKEAQAYGSAWGAPGLNFFESMSWWNFIFILLIGVSFFATAITEEKEEMTLGLMRMAGISPVALLLGKSTSRLFRALLLLAVQFPFAVLAITLGGVTLHQVLATYVALAAFLILTANVALFCSVCTKHSRTASWMTFLLLVVSLIGPALTYSFFEPLFFPDSDPTASTVIGTIFYPARTARAKRNFRSARRPLGDRLCRTGA